MKVTVKEVFQIELVDWGIGFDNILLMHIAIFLAIVRWLVHYLTQLHLQYKKKEMCKKNMFVNGTSLLTVYEVSIEIHY